MKRNHFLYFILLKGFLHRIRCDSLWFLVDVSLILDCCRLMYPSMLRDWCSWMCRLESAWWWTLHQQPFYSKSQNQSASSVLEPSRSSPVSSLNGWYPSYGCTQLIQAFDANRSSVCKAAATSCMFAIFSEDLNRLSPSPCTEYFPMILRHFIEESDTKIESFVNLNQRKLNHCQYTGWFHGFYLLFIQSNHVDFVLKHGQNLHLLDVTFNQRRITSQIDHLQPINQYKLIVYTNPSYLR